tara:strand:+ start:205 stop:498 length:294 start_codon:yes stop_codon:yes gene_type:complete
VDIEIEYNKNKYNKFYTYPNPHAKDKTIDMGHNLKLLKAPGSIMDAKKDFDYCRSLINFNHKYPFEEHYVEKQWNVHTCFHPCKPKVYDEKNKTNVF